MEVISIYSHGNAVSAIVRMWFLWISLQNNRPKQIVAQIWEEMVLVYSDKF